VKLHHQGNTLCVTDVPELNLANAANFAAELRAALWDSEENVVIDLSATKFVDCGGLGALAALSNKVRRRPVRLDLVNPTAPVLRLLRLTHFDRLLAPVAVGKLRRRSCKIQPAANRRRTGCANRSIR
jgi:anti-anti-sigma factor